ncbi:hypothetical protein DKM44_00470 [Deinococcus irradiatisoli]|uniref:Vancomycin resistance protein n=1 Tax=Deinococcus irradiatisoli TaxID=2202254 RepID=A0A2Z3J9W3_9DEIO|nr:VanW family protein [Deinococcus irradiatisoli]AWN21897.1 hypothetical protein DKM44_00470 [Deinococcus irradiatisoli]
MPRVFRSPLLLTLALLASPLAAASQEIPAAPLPSPAAPAPGRPAPTVPEPSAPTPEPTPLPDTQPTLPVTPAPTTPVVAPAPPPAVKPRPTDSLTLRFEASFPAVVDGKKTSVPYRETLVIPPERLALLRAQGKVTVSLDADFSAFLKRISPQPQDARFEAQPDGQWIIVQRNGLKLDETAARAALGSAIKDGQTTLLKFTPTQSLAPKRTLDYFVSRGITNFLAAGQTGYDGSSPERITNIHVGTHAFQDRLFEGKTFSFNQMLGPITTRAGFVTGLVIAGERTASGIGGGICQVSTTVFRALYGAGLPIVERRNHSYQVYYYDPQGLDATIYQPSQDLRFANDTGGPLWFQSDWDDAQKLLVVRVFGKARDFEVQVQEPRILSTTPSPPDKTVYDASLKKGERKQVDWAASGAVIEVDRLFVRNGQVFKRDTLKSSYRPWPNIFAVGR